MPRHPLTGFSQARMSPRGARTYGDRFLKGEDCFMTITQFPSGDVKQTASGADLTGDPDTAADAFNAMHDAARNPESPGQTGAQTGRSLNIGGGPSNPGAPGGSQPATPWRTARKRRRPVPQANAMEPGARAGEALLPRRLALRRRKPRRHSGTSPSANRKPSKVGLS
jgi:hypothetical protein